MSECILRAEQLTKKYRETTVVNSVSFHVERGEILGILGANGAGKTTLLSLLLGLIQPTSGLIKYFDQDFEKNRNLVLARVGSASAYTNLAAPLTVWQNLDIYGKLYGLPKQMRHQRIQELLKTLEIEHLANHNVQYLSAGEMTRATLIKAFLHAPEIVLLDEPTASLDIDIAKKIRSFILNQQKHGVSCIITSHNMSDMTELCDRIIVLDHGTIKQSATPEELITAIKISKVLLHIPQDMLEKGIAFAQQQNVSFKLLNSNDLEITVPTNEIAPLLQEITRAQIIYTKISIQDPTLDDFFLSLTTTTQRQGQL